MDDKAHDRDDPKYLEGGANGVAGMAAGMPAGGILGAVMGAGLAGPIGMLVGGTVGTMVGAAAGFGIDYESHETHFRGHHETMHPQNQPTFDRASPAYRHGWEGHDRPELQGRDYDEVRSALHQAWAGPGDFADHEDYVKHGWERRAAAARDDGMRSA